MRTLQLTTKSMCAGIVLDATGKCVDAAPVLKWMIGKGERWIKHHCVKHHIVVQELEDVDGRGRYER